MSEMSESPMSSNESSEDVPDRTWEISHALGSFVESKSSTFACGGRIAVKDTKTVASPLEPTSTSASAPPDISMDPFVLRWDPRSSTQGVSKLQFPLDPHDTTGSLALEALVKDCQPASFGYKGADILDETYRKAAKLDRSEFSVDFCPYETGIIDTVAQLLMPNSGTGATTSGVRAELYKLNIYAAPSGFFKPHVDTPRSSMQFGSLVVSLPCYHKGGQLIVRHSPHVSKFDWGGDAIRTSPSFIQWAAFYSDCEHEVLEVTEGYRITLTYNLYHAPGVGDLADNAMGVDIQSLPLFEYVRAALMKPDFMVAGGILGIYCRHAYAHTQQETASLLPGILKGSDMAVYRVFKQLGLQLGLRAILNLDENDWAENFEGMYNSDEYTSDDEEVQIPSVVGNLGGWFFTDVGGCDEGLYEIVTEWKQHHGGEFMHPTWINQPHHSAPAMAHLTYGNQAGIDTLYSHAALLVAIPPANKRGA